MPFNEEETLSITPPLASPKRLNMSETEPDFLADTLPAAFRLENTLGSFFANDTQMSDYEAGFNPIDLVPEQHMDQVDRYVFANNDKDVHKITAQIERERADRRTLEQSGGLGFAAMLAAGIADPINLIPVGGAAYRTYRVGGSILSGATVTGRAALLSTTAQEALLHQTQVTRTYGESALNIGAATFLGGVLGGSIGAVKGALSEAKLSYADDILPQVEKDLTIPGGSGGAARTDDIPSDIIRGIKDDVQKDVLRGKLTEEQAGVETARRIEEERLRFEGAQQTSKVFSTAEKGLAFQSPDLRLRTSGVRSSRVAASKLTETTMNLQKNAHDIATGENVERSVRNHQAKMYKALSGLDNMYAQYVHGHKKRVAAVVRGTAKANIDRFLNKADRKMTFKEFRMAVGDAMIRGDVHEIAEVEQAAKMFRSEVYDPLKDLAAKYIDPELGELAPTTAKSYLNRVYNKEYLSSQKGSENFIDITSQWLIGKQSDAIKRIDSFEAEIATLKGKELEARQKLQERDLTESRLDEADFRDLAGEILGRILSTPDGRLPYDAALVTDATKSRGKGRIGLSSNLQGRKFLIDDELIAPFLERDIETLSKLYVRNMAPDIEIKRLFPDDDLELTNLQKEIAREWQARSSTDPKWKDKMDADLTDVAALRDKLRGQFGLPENPMHWGNRVGRGMRQLNYIRLLGGMTISAIPDLARPVMVHGFTRVFRDAFLPMIRDFSTYAKATQEIKDMGLAMDMLNNARLQSIADITDDYARYSKLEKIIGAMSDTMGMVSLMAPWNTVMKQLAGSVSQARMIRAIRADIAGTIKKSEREYLRAAGIGQKDAKAIANQLKTYGKQSENGLEVSGWIDWQDIDAKRIFQSALGRDVDRIIITPGMDVPLWAGKTEVGRMIFQFKSFAFASTQRTLLSGLQQRDMASLNGMWLAVALGSLTAGIKMVDRGKGDEVKDWSVNKWLVEGVDRSGLTGWLFEANNMIERATRGHVGASALAGEAPMSRYASRNLGGALLGPSLGLVTTLGSVTGGLSDAVLGEGEWTESDTHAVRRMLPYQNLLGFRNMIDKAEENINSSLGVRR